MTELQKLILDALDQLGTMTEHELRTACLIGKKQYGGFRTSLNRCFVQKWVRAMGPDHIGISKEGVFAIEAANIAACSYHGDVDGDGSL